MKTPLFAIALASMALSTSAIAGTVTVTSTAALSATSWGVAPGENSAGATIGISTAAPRSGNGSIEMRGDTTRLQMGYQYPGAFQTNLMLLSSVTGLSFDWRIAGDSVSGYSADYTPALRLLIQDGSQRSQLIWEGAYNGTYGNTARDTWYSTSFSDSFYQNVAGAGVTLANGAQVNKTVAQWIAQNYSSSAFVSAISVGDGSGALPTYHAFADNVTLGTTAGNTTYNFEPVPEPGTWAATLLGAAAVGLRRRKAAKKA